MTFALGDVTIVPTICRWHWEFQKEDFSLKETKKKGRPQMSIKKENLTDVSQILDKDKQAVRN